MPGTYQTTRKYMRKNTQFRANAQKQLISFHTLILTHSLPACLPIFLLVTMKVVAFAALIPCVSAFLTNLPAGTVNRNTVVTSLADATEPFELMTIDMPPSGSMLQANLKIKPILSVPSEMIEVRYKLPFGLDVAPKKGLAVCTKSGAGGEQEGDVLRYTSRWSMGLPSGDGLVSSAAAFSGGISWQCTMFNVMNAESWEEVVEALVSNDQVIFDFCFDASKHLSLLFADIFCCCFPESYG